VEVGEIPWKNVAADRDDGWKISNRQPESDSDKKRLALYLELKKVLWME